MKLKWYLRIEGEVKGPYTLEDLAQMTNYTPDTPALLEGTEHWRPMGDVEELQCLFQDPPHAGLESDEESTGDIDYEIPADGELTLTQKQQQLPFYLLTLLLALLIYMWVKFMLNN